MDPNHNDQPGRPPRKLTLLDAVCVIVGTIIGAGIFGTAGEVARMLPGAQWLVIVWIAGGIISLVGCLCFAELTTAYNEPGGDYYYLTRAFGYQTGLAFAWAAFWIVRPGNIGAMAMIFAQYAVTLFGLTDSIGTKLILALLAVASLSIVNLLGVRTGKSTQNILTIIKVLGILSIFVAAALVVPKLENPIENLTAGGNELPHFGALFLPMVLVMFTYGGWNDISFVAAEVRQPRRNLPLSLVIGTLIVTVCYVGFNIALLLVLGFDHLAQPGETAPSAMMSITVAGWGSQLLSCLVCISCLGAINGMVFTSPRIYYAVGQKYSRLAWLSNWGGRHDGPWAGILCQALISMLLIAICGMRPDGFKQILAVTAPYFWVFLALTFASLMILRRKTGSDSTAFRVPLYPLPPIFMVIVSLGIAYSCIQYIVLNQFWVAAILIGVIMVVGVIVAVSVKPRSSQPDQHGS